MTKDGETRNQANTPRLGGWVPLTEWHVRERERPHFGASHLASEFQTQKITTRIYFFTRHKFQFSIFSFRFSKTRFQKIEFKKFFRNARDEIFLVLSF